MKKNNKIRLEQIVARKCKGYAFMQYPTKYYKSAEDLYDSNRKEVETDFNTLSEKDFREKYAIYIY